MKKIAVLFLFLQMFAVQAFAQQYKYHVVKRGETTGQIARQYNISEETLFRYNPDARRGIKPDGKLVVPITTGSTETQQTSTGEEQQQFVMHKVKRQETLFSLSQQYNVNIEDIKRFNKHLYSSELRRGERIRIPKGSPKNVAQNPTPSRSNPLDLSIKEHVVLPQETLYGISRRYNVTIADMQRSIETWRIYNREWLSRSAMEMSKRWLMLKVACSNIIRYNHRKPFLVLPVASELAGTPWFL